MPIADSTVKQRLFIIPVVALLVSCNPFAPGLDTDLTTNSILGDQTTIDGVFQNIKYAYTFRDTSIYGQLVNSDFTFSYRDYDRGVDVTWGRDEELRTTSGLFQNVERLDLVWNNIAALSSDSSGIQASVTRNFNLTVTFNASDIIRVDGYANFALARPQPQSPWKIVRWQDESNY
jgi:hypothetical protein